ncbi:MAG: VTT domain-containing protein [Bacilli bacterium]|nr:VTT domain-containing protein [Bacilli bacterium]
MEFLKNIDVFLTTLFENIGLWAPILSSFLILVESILPIMPLAVFITINFYYFGTILGFLLSWILTCIGCYISFLIFRNKVKFWFDSKLVKKNEGKLTKLMIIVNNLSFEQLVLLFAIPFTPTFVFNIVAGVSSMTQKKFICSLLLGKLFLVFFWGFIGITFLNSLTEPIKFLQILLLCILAFIISKIVNKKFNID